MCFQHQRTGKREQKLHRNWRWKICIYSLRMTDCSVGETRMRILSALFSAVSSASGFLSAFSVALRLQAIKSSSKRKCVEFMPSSVNWCVARKLLRSLRFYISISIALVSMRQTNSKTIFFVPSHSRWATTKTKYQKLLSTAINSRHIHFHSHANFKRFRTHNTIWPIHFHRVHFHFGLESPDSLVIRQTARL